MDDRELRWLWNSLKFCAKVAIATRLWIPGVACWIFDMVQPTGFAWLLWCLIIAATFSYVAAFWVRGGIRKFKKDPEWAYFAAYKGRKKEMGVNALAGNKPASEAKSERPTGIVFGRNKHDWVVRPEKGKDHVLIIGAPGTGKSQAIALPSLAVWHGGLLAIDIKGELWNEVGKEQEGAMRFAVEDPDAYGFDPFATAKANPEKRHDVARTIALTLIPDNPGEKEKYWTEQSQNLLTAALLTGMEQGWGFIKTMDAVTLAGADALVQWISEYGNAQADIYNSSFLEMDREKTLPAVYSTLHGKVAVFSVDADVRECFDREKAISPSDLEQGKKVYLCLPETKLEAWKNVVSMLIKLFLKDAESWPDGRSERTLFLVDEMPRLGKIPAITSSLATLRSKGVALVLLVQTIAQMRSIYGRDETDAILDLCSVKAILSASGDTAELCAKLVGESVQKLRNSGVNAQSFDPLKRGTNTGVSEQWHAVMQASDFQHMGEYLVLIEPRSGALRVEKMPYWQNKETYLTVG